MTSMSLKTKTQLGLLTSLLLAVVASACGLNEDGTSGDCDKNPDDATQYVIIGFWDNDTCSGDPVNTNAFPIDATAACYCWPGHSGENSAQAFSCDYNAGSFTYTQYTDLICGDGGAGTEKTSYTDQCTQDVPPTLYSKILDISACAP